MKHLYLWLVLAVTCVMLACSEDKVESDKDSNLQTEIHVDTNTLIFNQNESVKLLEFSTNKDWTISIASTIMVVIGVMYHELLGKLVIFQ